MVRPLASSLCSCVAPRDVQHMRMRISAIDSFCLGHSKPMRPEPLDERCRPLIAERSAEGEVEEGGEGFLQTIDRMLHARRGIVLFNDENSAGREPLMDAIEQRIPISDR